MTVDRTFKAAWVLIVIFLLTSCGAIPENGGVLDGEGEIKGILDDDNTNKDKPEEDNHQTQIPNNDSESVFERAKKAAVTIHPLDQNGEILAVASGVIISDYLIATNFHVIEEATSFKVTYNANQNVVYTNNVFKIDEHHDVAILQVHDPQQNLIQFDTEEPKIGDDVIVAGSPSGLDGTVSKGIVSAYRIQDPFDYDVLQIDAPISPGSSGGPVLNKSGLLIGISMSGMREGNLNFAVPAKYIKRLLD
jgi:S1-C subfamily serine protease